MASSCLALCWATPISHESNLFSFDAPDRNAFYGVKDLPDLAVRHHHWKLLCEYDGSQTELCDLAEDPGETKDLAERYPEKIDHLKRIAGMAPPCHWTKDLSGTEPEHTLSIDQTMKQNLRRTPTFLTPLGTFSPISLAWILTVSTPAESLEQQDHLLQQTWPLPAGCHHTGCPALRPVGSSISSMSVFTSPPILKRSGRID